MRKCNFASAFSAKILFLRPLTSAVARGVLWLSKSVPVRVHKITAKIVGALLRASCALSDFYRQRDERGTLHNPRSKIPLKSTFLRWTSTGKTFHLRHRQSCISTLNSRQQNELARTRKLKFYESQRSIAALPFYISDNIAALQYAAFNIYKRIRVRGVKISETERMRHRIYTHQIILCIAYCITPFLYYFYIFTLHLYREILRFGVTAFFFPLI